MSKKNGFKHKQLDIRIKIGISLMAGLLAFLITFSGLMSEPNTLFSNWVYQSTSVSTLPITILGIDEKTMEEIGQPTTWSRQVYADLLNMLNVSEDHRPAVIAFDMLYTNYYNDKDGDLAFAEAAGKYNNVVVGINTDTVYDADSPKFKKNKVVFPYKELAEKVSLGYTNCDSGKYHYVTTFLTGTRADGTWYDCLAVATLKKFKQFVENNKEFAALHPEYKDINIPDYSKEATNEYRFSFSSSEEDLEVISLIDVLNGDTDIRTFENNIVLLGAFATGLQDNYRILFSDNATMNGVSIHANIMQALYEGRIQIDASTTVLAIIYAFIVAGLSFFMLSVDIIKGIIIGAVALLLHFISSIIIYNNGLYIPLLYMMICCIALIIGIIVFHYLNARSERMKINNAFRMYVAPEIVDDVAGAGTYQLHLGGRNKDIAVLFVDIRGFTTMSENLAPEEVVDILNEYFGVITDAIFKNKGTLDKFIGDAAMAVFNSPFDLDDYVYRAVSTACDIAKASESLGEKLMERFGKKVSYGIGVNCGEAIIGNIGSNFRMDYTAIGDTVNTASRLESNAKAGEILISEEVKKRLDGRLITEDVGEIPLKGKSKKIFVYRVLSLKDTDTASTESAESAEV